MLGHEREVGNIVMKDKKKAPWPAVFEGPWDYHGSNNIFKNKKGVESLDIFGLSNKGHVYGLWGNVEVYYPTGGEMAYPY
jgi:hypothetical protein